MNKFVSMGLACLCAAACLPQAAIASQATSKKTDTSAAKKVAMPAKEAPPIPTFEPATPANAAPVFPSLPPARPCEQDDMKGLWRLAAVYEDPQGPETTAYQASPNQYSFYKRDNTFGKFNAGRTEMSPKSIFENIQKHTSGLMQYLLQDSGFIYFYNDGVATDVQACFIVSDSRVPFEEGEMLMMPPKGQIQGRLVKVYKAIKGNHSESKNGKKRGGKAGASKGGKTGGGPKHQRKQE